MDLHEFSRVGKDKESLLKKFEYLKDAGLDDYRQYAQQVFCVTKLPNWEYAKLVELTIYKSYIDKDKKETDLKKKYHLANVVSFLKVVEDILSGNFITWFTDYQTTDEKDILVHNYSGLFKHLLFDAMYVFDDFQCRFQQKKQSCWKSFSKPPFHFFLLLEQCIFGQVSCHSFMDKSEDLSVAVIRMMLESRLRRAFDYWGTVEKSTGRFRELSMSILFDALAETARHFPKVEFLKRSQNLDRIYQWACLYIHGAHSDLSWKPILVMNYLKDNMIHTQKGNKISVDYGISMPRSAMDYTRALLTEKINEQKKGRCEVYSTGEFELYIEED